MKDGARPIKRFVSRNLESLIANAILKEEIKYNSEVKIDLDDNHLVIV